METKQKSGSRKRKLAEEKARNDLADRPGQTKISKWCTNFRMTESNSSEGECREKIYFVPFL